MNVLLLALFLVTAKTPRPAVPSIAPAELKALMDKGEAVAIDVRGSVPYDLAHIEGAISLPLGLIAGRAMELPQDKLIVAYCACKREELSDQAVRQLNNHGIERAAALKGGYDGWVAAGLPVVKQVEEPADAPPPTARFRVPPFVTCDRSDVTVYPGEVIRYKRSKGKAVIRIHTDEDTTEEVTANAPESFFINGAKFTAADWKRIEVSKGKLRPHMRAVAWFCRTSKATFIDWQIAEK